MTDFFSTNFLSVAPAIQPEQPAAPMSDKRLAEYERMVTAPCTATGCACERDAVHALTAEIHRLKRENHLLHLSRGDMGLD